MTDHEERMVSVAAGLHLDPDARVAIVGGGPAGSFCALHLLRFARQASLPLQVTIFERKDFSKRGQTGCNKCAGILATRVPIGLEELGLSIPPHLVMAELEGYTLHVAGQSVEVLRPTAGPKILSVYRGGGPLHADLSPEVSFDAWLLSAARLAGAEVVAGNVRSLRREPGVLREPNGPLGGRAGWGRSFERAGAGKIEVATEAWTRAFDLVVLAGGVNARPPAMEGLDYVPPQTATMAQDELALAAPAGRPAFAGRSQVQVYTGGQPGLMFGALIPKGDLLNVSLLGRRLAGDAIDAFLDQPDRRWLADAGAERLCGCHPKINVAQARNAFADRFVAIGDAAATRLYKDGIGSAFATARQAAWTALHDGISARAFAQGYAPVCRAIERDNRVGRLLFSLWDSSQAQSIWGRAIVRALVAEQDLPPGRRRGHQALRDLLTGNDSYIGIARRLLHPVGALTFFDALRQEIAFRAR
jgi:flavin-dependent dehydrogenase